MCASRDLFLVLFFFNDTATTEIYTLSLHDALPISFAVLKRRTRCSTHGCPTTITSDRKSTRLNSSHGYISYAVFCLKKKKKQMKTSDAPKTHEENVENDTQTDYLRCRFTLSSTATS